MTKQGFRLLFAFSLTLEETHIVYQAAPYETVYVKGSEQIPSVSWKHDSGNVYYAVLNSAMFGSYNPFTAPLVFLCALRIADDMCLQLVDPEFLR